MRGNILRGQKGVEKVYKLHINVLKSTCHTSIHSRDWLHHSMHTTVRHNEL